MKLNLRTRWKRRGVIGFSAALATGFAAAPAAGREDETRADWRERRKRLFVEHRVRRMSTEERVAQLFVTYVHGETADTTDPADVAANQELYGVDNADQLLQRHHLGGIIYFAWSNNVNDPEQITGLSNGLQEAAAATSGIPLLISTDQEHGLVTRIGAPATQLPGAMALGAAHSPDAAYEAAVISGGELRAMGLNQNFAPVADVNVNPDNPVIGVRSFSSDPALASEMVAAQVEGYQAERDLASTVKHFPGHGDTGQDSHNELPRIEHTHQEWQELDAPPFAAAIESGVDAIMTAHIQFPALDETLKPATLSEPILTGLLREELGFDGVVITDSLRMEGVRTEYGDDRVPVMAILAGADLLLMPPDLELAYNAVLAAVESGEISEQRLEQSLTRILGLKYDLGLFEDAHTDPDELWEVLGTPEHLEAAQSISDKTVTLVVNDGALPVTAPGTALVTGWGASTTAGFAAALEERGWTTEHLATGDAPGQEAIGAAVTAAAGKDLIVVATNGVAADPAQAELVAALHGTGVPVVAAAVRNPYDIAHYLGSADACLATYSYGAGGIESAVRTILGENSPVGRLPVDIPSADDPDTVLFALGHGLGYE